MGTVTRMEKRRIDELIPYERNAKLHPQEQIEMLRRSFREFGMIVPVGIDAENRVLYGHGRLQAAREEGWQEVPTVLIEDLTEEQRKAFVHADNLLGETGYDKELLRSEVKALQETGFDISLIGFEAAGISLTGNGEHFWETEGESTGEYEEFEDKFKPKLTTDDCYTPVRVYEAVKNWAVEKYALEGAEIIRPFYPGGDYMSEEYPEGCVVIDNPPFSILSEICRFYQEKKISFFLFAPGLTLFSIGSGEMNYIPTGVPVIYENGARVSTSFVTNMGEWKIDTCPDLYELVTEANETDMRSIPNYQYPGNVICTVINNLAKYGETLQIKAGEATFIRGLDAQKEEGKNIYGAGFLISNAAAERKQKAEKAVVEGTAKKQWQLSERERQLIAKLGDEDIDGQEL